MDCESTCSLSPDSIRETAFYFVENGDKRNPLAAKDVISGTRPLLAQRARRRGPRGDEHSLVAARFKATLSPQCH